MILLEKPIHEFPRLDDNVKSLENDSSVTNNNTMICQALLWYSRSKNFHRFPWTILIHSRNQLYHNDITSLYFIDRCELDTSEGPLQQAKRKNVAVHIVNLLPFDRMIPRNY